MRNSLLPLFLLSAVAMVGCAGSDGGDGTDATAADLSEVKVTVENSASLGLNEVSGLGVRTVSGKPQYLAIGDSSTTLLTFNIGSDGKPTSIKRNDLKSIFGAGESQWEAVAGDSSGKVFLENESQGTVSILDADLKLKHVITLTLPDDSPLKRSWDRDENSRGEGMLLLSNGHILIAKEKGPSAIIEFAPKGQDAKGYAPGQQLKGAFKVPSGDASEFIAVKSWELKSSAINLIGDISDLTVDADGTIIVLSDQSRAIARIEKELSLDEDKIDVKQMWDLPKEVDKPEGIQLVDGKPFVACDLRKNDDISFFSISAL